MVKMHKLTKGGQTIYPATIYDAVVNPKTRKSLTTEISDLDIGLTSIEMSTPVFIRSECILVLPPSSIAPVVVDIDII